MKSLGLVFLLMLVLVNTSAGYEVPTHQKLFEYSLPVLANDGYQKVADIFSQESVKNQILAGLRDADEKNTDAFNWDHGMDPWLHQGFSVLKPSAGQISGRFLSGYLGREKFALRDLFLFS